jgi:hypothetical protein
VQAVDKPRQRLDCPRLVRGWQSARSYATLLGLGAPPPSSRCAPMEVVWSFIEPSVLRFESPGHPRSLRPLGLVSKGGVLLSGSSLLFFLSGDDAR